MADITSFSGAQLLLSQTLDAISREADSVIARTDVAAAWKAAAHLKKELSVLPQAKVQSILPGYRRIVAKLKALSLPLLEADEVKNLLQNNLPFLEDSDARRLDQGLAAWLAMQDEADREKFKKEFDALKNGAQKSAPMPASEKVEVSEEREIADHARLAAHFEPSAKQTGADVVAASIARLAAQVDDSIVFTRRARSLVESRLRDVRTAAQFGEYARRPLVVGGLGLPEEAAEKAEQLVEDAYRIAHARPLASVALVEEPKPTPSRPATPPPALPTPPSQPISVPLAPPSAPKPIKASIPAPAPVAKKLEPVAIQKQPTRRPMRPAGSFASGKRRLDDITTSLGTDSSPKTVSRAQELAVLAIADFRGLGDATAATSSILSTVANISETLADRQAAVAAFRQSPLFTQYISIGRASLTQGKKLAEALADSAVNPDTMTEDEFFAVSALNNKLK